MKQNRLSNYSGTIHFSLQRRKVSEKYYVYVHNEIKDPLTFKCIRIFLDPLY